MSQPARASSTAIGRPIERIRPAPVTTATLSVSPVSSYVTRPTVRSAPARPRTVGADLARSHHDRLEVRRRLRSHRRRRARPPVPDPRRPRRHVGRARSPAPTRWPPTWSRPGLGAPGEGRLLPLQLPRVPRGRASPRSRARSCRSTRTSATGPTRSTTCSTTPTPRPSSSTPRSPSCSRGSATGCPGVKRWYVVADEAGAGPGLGDAVRGRRDVGRRRSPTAPARSGDDLLFLYTGGTTGMPKGVMWRQDDLFNVIGAGRQRAAGRPAGDERGRGRRRGRRPTRTRRARSCAAR